MATSEQHELLETGTSYRELTDEVVDQILSRYRRQRFLQSLAGPCISFSLHAVMFATAVAIVALPSNRESGFTVTCQEVQGCILDEPEEVIEEIIELEQELKESLSIMSSSTDLSPDSSTEVNDISFDGETEPSDQAPATADCVSTESPLLFYSAQATSSQQSSGGIQIHRTACGQRCIQKKVARYGSPDSPRIQQAVLTPALNWLARVQNPNGSWGTGRGWGSDSGHPAHTGLATLVFLAQGKTPMSPIYGTTVQKALRWLTAYGTQEDLSLVIRKRHGAYSHGIATYALAEAYGLTRVPFLSVAVENCIEKLIDGQMANGGFGYAYTSGPRWDMSVTGWNIQAMKAAQLTGCQSLRLEPAMVKSVQFLKQVTYSGGGRFGYAGTSPSPRPNMAGVGVLCLQLLEASPSKESVRGYNYIISNRLAKYQEAGNSPDKWNSIAGNSLYGWYYDTQVIFNSQGSSISRKHWDQWRDAFEKALESSQNKEGYWETNGKHTIGTSTTDGRVLATCLCALQLEVFYRRLPTYGVKKQSEKKSNNDQNAMTAVGNGMMMVD